MAPELVAAGMVAVGLQLSLQAPVNGELALRTGPLGAALLSFLVGLFLLAAVLVVSGDISGYGNLGGVPIWQLAGGLIGAGYVTAAAWAVGRVGAGAIAAATVAGQLSSGIVVDHAGWFGLDPDPVGPLRLLAVPVLVAGALLVSGDRAGGGVAGIRRIVPLPVITVFVAGLAVGVQHPLNAELADRVGDLGAAGMNFTTGTLALAGVVLVTGGASRLPAAREAPPWAFAGGLIGSVTVLASLAAVGVIGASVLAATTIAGALAGSVLIDRFGIAGVDVRLLDRARVAGLVLLALGTAAVL